MWKKVGLASNWDWVGTQLNSTVPTLYRIVSGATPALGDALTKAEENVILFNGDSRMWVRYHDKKSGDTEFKEYYGELQGFFRMKSPLDPYGTESFAYARQKVTSGSTNNTADGGFLSYTASYNYFTDDGDDYTKTEQYPYINVVKAAKADGTNYRMWLDTQLKGNRWYVDGTKGWGTDEQSKTAGCGRFPDKPKKTIFGTASGTKLGGVVTEHQGSVGTWWENDFSYKNDIIYVVGALSAADEGAMVDSIGQDGTEYPLRVFRYPGGHEMSNDKRDYGGGTANWGSPTGDNGGPGPNYGALLNVQASQSASMRGVVMDGLYRYESTEVTYHDIHTDLPSGAMNFDTTLVTQPLIVTASGSELTMTGGTVLKRGYNNTDGNVWYTNTSYSPVAGVYHGGALYVDPAAIVNVEGLVTITDNWQKRGSGSIKSNVYLPTFATYLRIAGDVTGSNIGVTNPIRNDQSNYVYNTFSPVAVATRTDHEADDAEAAWTNNSFHDDLDRFFYKEGPSHARRTSYYSNSILDHPGYVFESGSDRVPITANKTVFFGWTWANVVTAEPDGFVSSETPNNIVIDSPNDLAWLISKVNGLNGQTADNLSAYTGTKKITQTADLDMQKYVWVPIGANATGAQFFSGYYEGNGHIIQNLDVDYIGSTDLRYEYTEYGLFGYVNSDEANHGVINRTFVVSGLMRPVGTANIGGLAGKLCGVNALISNSEAAVTMVCPDVGSSALATGGLVGKMMGGSIHSSMAMPDITFDNYRVVGGLVGSTEISGSTTPAIKNSFANAKFTIENGGQNTTYGAGGLVGLSTRLEMRNCYSHLYDNVIGLPKFALFVAENENSSIQCCYGFMEGNYSFCNTIAPLATCAKYTSTIDADKLGYMYSDNVLEGDTTLVARLNLNAWKMNPSDADTVYSHWARPGLTEINQDLPVLLLGEFDGDYNYQGSFRSVGTYAGGPVLQYGGPVRDGSTDEVNLALSRAKASAANDYLFIYGDVNSIGDALTITQSKVSIYEHASIKSPGVLGSTLSTKGSAYTDTYVGISFDNSCGKAESTPGVNYGLNGLGIWSYLLPRDYHMFSTPLINAPMGFNYGSDNASSGPSNNPWTYPSMEFSWLNDDKPGDIRYWMASGVDGYFPTDVDESVIARNDELFVVGSDECPESGRYRYRYGMDFYTWYEPEYHWINFKRNGPNHWHTDEPHAPISYYGSGVKVNETTMIPAKGYLASITKPTFMESHGSLNKGPQSIALTKTPTSKLIGWNLVGNPYHGYLDFGKLAMTNSTVLATDEGTPFYVVYDADTYNPESPGTGFLYQPAESSKGGEYAGPYIHPHQAFYVKISDAEGVSSGSLLQFTESMVVTRDDINESHFREWERNYPLVNLYLSSDKGCADVTVIEFDRPEWGGATKLKELRVGNGQFYAHHGDNNYAAL